MYTRCIVIIMDIVYSKLLFRLFKTDVSMASPLVVAFTYYHESSDVSPQAQGYKYFIQLHTSGSPSRVFLDPIAVVAQGNDLMYE